MPHLHRYAIGAVAGAAITAAAFLLMPPSAATRAENLYAAAKSDGALLSACRFAGQAAEAWGAAGDDDKFSQWKATERSDCAQAELAGQSYSSQYR